MNAKNMYEQRMAEIERDARNRRDRFAAAALTGYCSNPDMQSLDSNKIAALAVADADALIAELDKPVTP